MRENDVRALVLLKGYRALRVLQVYALIGIHFGMLVERIMLPAKAMTGHWRFQPRLYVSTMRSIGWEE